MQSDSSSSSNVDDLVPSSRSALRFIPLDHGIPSSPYNDTWYDFPGLSHLTSQPVFDHAAAYPPIQGTPPISPTPSPASFDDDDPVTIENRLYLSRLALQYKQIADQYELCLTQLQDAEREAEAITLQNSNLCFANDELYRRLNIEPAENKLRNSVTNEYPPVSLLDEHFRRLSLVDPPDEASPTSVFEFQENRLARNCFGLRNKRTTLPKSISVRSSGYLKVHQTGGGSSEANRSSRNRPHTPVMNQKVCLGGAGKEVGEAEYPVDLDLYKQGMFKTELCNKWQESGDCPYGEHCQFAHGIRELRPILRHPRYKTELCRMVLASDTCPYGHRCHFRHVITPQDRLLRPS